MQVVKVLAERSDSVDSNVGNILALSKNQVSQAWSDLNNLLHSMIGDTSTACKVENTEVFICSAVWQIKECVVGDELALGKTKLTQAVTVLHHSGNWLVSYRLAELQIQLENVRAVLGELHDRLIHYLVASVKLELEEVSIQH